MPAPPTARFPKTLLSKGKSSPTIAKEVRAGFRIVKRDTFDFIAVVVGSAEWVRKGLGSLSEIVPGAPGIFV